MFERGRQKLSIDLIYFKRVNHLGHGKRYSRVGNL